MKVETKRKIIKAAFTGMWVAFVAMCVVAFTLFYTHNCLS